MLFSFTLKENMHRLPISKLSLVCYDFFQALFINVPLLLMRTKTSIHTIQVNFVMSNIAITVVFFSVYIFFSINRIGRVMVSVLASSAVDRGFEPRSGQTKDNKIGICCFSAKHTVIRRKSTDWLALNPNSVSEWGDMSTRDCCFIELAL